MRKWRRSKTLKTFFWFQRFRLKRNNGASERIEAGEKALAFFVDNCPIRDRA